MTVNSFGQTCLEKWLMLWTSRINNKKMDKTTKGNKIRINRPAFCCLQSPKTRGYRFLRAWKPGTSIQQTTFRSWFLMNRKILRTACLTSDYGASATSTSRTLTMQPTNSGFPILSSTPRCSGCSRREDAIKAYTLLMRVRLRLSSSTSFCLYSSWLRKCHPCSSRCPSSFSGIRQWEMWLQEQEISAILNIISNHSKALPRSS